MPDDRYGLSLSTSSLTAGLAYIEGVDRLLSANAGAEERFDRALAADPGFALAHAGRARVLQLQARAAEARAAAERARALAGGASRRERQHVEALALTVSGDAAGALTAIRAHLAEFPRDAMALSPATGVYGLIGASGRQARNEELRALLEGLAPAYGDDWWFLGAYGFALTEARGWRAGAPLIRRSLELDPRNAHAAHAHAHVLYEGGADRDGAVFVAAWMTDYPRAAQLHCHLSWHQALFELAQGKTERTLALYEESIRPGASLSPAMPTLADAASLLWRAELAGEPHRAGPWRELARYGLEAFPSVGLFFADLHSAVALAGAGETEALARRVAALREADAAGRLGTGPVLPIVCEAFGAFAGGRYSETVTLLSPVTEQFVRIGGSQAQRDLIEYTLLAAYLRCGRDADARALLMRRVDRQPSAPVHA
jgi:hypothetical protein